MLHTRLNRNFEGWICFSKYTHTIKQMDGSMTHFKKLPKPSIISLSQLLAGLDNRVVKTFCFSVSSLLCPPPLPPLQPSYLTTAAPAARRSVLPLALAAQRHKRYTHCAGEEGTNPGFKAEETCVSSSRQRAERVQRPLMLK